MIECVFGLVIHLVPAMPEEISIQISGLALHDVEHPIV